MEVQLSPEQAAELSRIANETGRSADVLAREAVDRYLTEERGDFVETSEVWARVERALKA
jgi:predicted DNA-binding protein